MMTVLTRIDLGGTKLSARFVVVVRVQFQLVLLKNHVGTDSAIMEGEDTSKPGILCGDFASQ